MMNVNRIVGFIEARLETLANKNESALDNLMRTDIDEETFNLYENIYDETFERMIELRRILRAIVTYDSDSDSDIE